MGGCCEPVGGHDDLVPIDQLSHLSCNDRLPSINLKSINIQYFEGMWGRAYPIILMLEHQGIEYV